MSTVDTVVETRGASVHCRIEGPRSAPVLALVNSLGTSLEMWDLQLPAFLRHFRVLRYDQRGHGRSSAPPGPYSIEDLGEDFFDVLDAFEVREAAVCGLSLGGMVAMWAATRSPDRVSSLVLACTSPAIGSPGTWHERASAVRRHGVSPLAQAQMARWFPPSFEDRRPQVVSAATAMLESCAAEGYAACCEALAATDLGDRVSAIAAPTLVIGGADDPVTTSTTVLALAGSIPGSSLVVLGDASHLANLAQPDAFSSAALDHLAGTATQRGAAVRRAVLGDAHVERSARRQQPLAGAFVDFVTRYAWGDVWARPGLDRRTRSVVTLAVLVATGHVEELEFHVPAALRNGLDEEEIREIALHCAIYAGVPVVNSAIEAVERALAAAVEDGGGG